jgi:hypothetical protein
MEYSVGAGAVRKFAPYSGPARVMVLAIVLSSFVLPDGQSEAFAAEAGLQTAELQSIKDRLRLVKPKPEQAGADLGLAQEVLLWPRSADLAQGLVEQPEDGVPPASLDAGAVASLAVDPMTDSAIAVCDRTTDQDDTGCNRPPDQAEAAAQAPGSPGDSLAPAERSEVFVQAAYLQQGSDGSARLRAGGIYVLSPSVLAGATADLSTGPSFSDSDQTGLSLSELYLTASPANLPELRFTVGLMDLTSYLDRNSFAKDSLTHFFNPVFQTNPALSTVNVASRPGALVNWTPVDAVSLTATTFSANRSLGSFALDSFAGEVGVRLGNAIVRGTYVTSTDAGRGDGFAEIFSFDRGNGQFGPLPGDRETGYGLNAEAFIPGLNLGLFGRYGWYTNHTLGASGQTYSLGPTG